MKTKQPKAKPKDISAWTKFHDLLEFHGRYYVQEILYSWFVAEYKTLSYENSGILCLLKRDEPTAIKILLHAEKLLKSKERHSSASWEKFLKKQSNE